MEQDNHIKQLLLNSAEGASVNFTDAVLKKIDNLSVVRRYDHPLVPQKLQRLFLATFGFVVIMIFVLCLVIAAAHKNVVNWIKNWQLPEIGYDKIVVFILCFWIVFAANALLQKKVLSAQGAFDSNFE